MHEANAAHSILNLVIKTLSALGSPCSEGVLLYSFISVGPVVKSPGKRSLEEDHYEEKQTSVHFSGADNGAQPADPGGLRRGGGIVGLTYHSAPVIENCYNIGDVTGTNRGGIAGKLLSGEVRSCYQLAGSGVGILGDIDTDYASAEDCFTFVSDNGTHTLEGSVCGTSDLLTALKTWVADHNTSSEYLNWRADELNNNYPVFAKYYTVTFEPNGGTVSPASGTTNDSYTLTSLPTPSRRGYSFDGWFTAADGGDEVTTETLFSGNTTIYAHWTYINSGWNGSSMPVNPIIVEDTVNGSMAAGQKTATAGTTVTVTIKTDTNRSLGSLTAADAKGSVIRLIDNGNGTFTFVMPASEVYIRGIFVPGSSPFRDVSENSYYYDAVLWAAENGITGGTGNGLFSPDDPCTRAQAVVFLFRAKAGDTVTLQNLVSGYGDSGDVPGYALPAMNWALYTGVIKGSGGKLMPIDFCTRAQIVTFLWRAYQGK